MFKKIRIQNLRALRDTDWVEIKPLTILLGANSSGKSTFLRTFPLMTQSVNKRLRNAIAWFDEMLVDFGDFQTSLNRDAALNDEPITLSFQFEDLSRFLEERVRSFHLRYLAHSRLYDSSMLSISFRGKSDNKEAYISEVNIRIEGNLISFHFNDKNKICDLCLNDETVQINAIKWRERGPSEYLPLIFIESQESEGRSLRHLRYSDDISQWALDKFRVYCGGHFRHLEKLDPLLDLWNRDKAICLENFKKFKGIKNLENEIKKWKVKSSRFLRCYNSILICKVLQSWDRLSLLLAEYFSLCDYAAPIRAEAKRYYRNQGLQTERIDAYGRNTSEFIDSLTETQRGAYNDYLEKILKVKIAVRNSMGHQSINLKSGENESTETNITDVGFGYSQILPIISKLWLMQTRKRFQGLSYYRASFATALIEQPELHLHPRLQAKLTDAFIHAAINQDAPSTLIVETHSPTIINRVGRRIREGHIPSDKVNVVIFDKDFQTGNAKVRTVKFSDNGQIQDWPYGFFEPVNDEF